MNKIYVLDAVNYLFRSYYAIGPMMNEKGQSTSALYGFIRSVQKIIADFSPDHLVAVFDGPDNKKSRREIYADYKMHREGAPEDLYPQFEWAFEFCEAAGIPALCIDGVEADDTMATIACWAEGKKAKVFLCSSDKDLMQLVNDNIHIIHIHKDNLIIDAAGVQHAFGVKPNQMLDLLAIMGDASDNIPGLPGFGPKTAASLLQEFGTLDAILAHPEKVKGEKKQEILRKERDLALMSRELATLDTKVEIPQKVEFYRLKEPSHLLPEFYHRMNFNSLLRDLGAVPSPKKKQPVDRRDYRLVDSESELKKLFTELSHAQEVCIDTETTSEKPMQAHLVGISFCREPGTAFYLPCNGELGESAVLAALREFFSTAKTRFYGHNLKYDWHVLANFGIELKKEQISFDTILASYLLEPQNRRHGLDDLSLAKFKKIKIPISDLIGKGKQQKTMSEVPIEQVKDYACEDADMTAQLKELFEEELAERGLEKLNREVELPLLLILAKMERVGIYLDREKLKECGLDLAKKIAHLKSAIFDAVHEEFNINSPQQLSRILYEKLKLQPPGKKKTETSTSASILEELREQHPVVQYILDYRTAEKLRSTYIDALPEAIHPKTGRIHCTFNQSVAATGRLSCQDPNLQNIPIRGDLGKEIRSCFKPEKKGWSYLGADYSQIELRLLAHLSEDPELISAFNKGEDIHTHTASLIFGVQRADVTQEMRFRAKAINFGILYGQGPYGLAKETGLSMHDAAIFIQAYFERYPQVKNYIEACKKSVKTTGIAKTLLGRQRPIPEITNQNPSIRSMAERLAVNTPLQGTAADLIKMAMIAIDRTIEEEKLRGTMILQIHDELIFEVPDNELPTFESFVKKEMEGVLSLSVPLVVSIAIGKNWGEC